MTSTNTDNPFFLGSDLDSVENPSEETMIKVDHVSMIFNMASETLNNLKEYAIALARKELRFKEFRALDNVSLEVKKGDVYGILGSNGSGKSTLLKIVAGVLDPTKGTCEINGNIAPLIELGAGFDMELTARENIYLNGALLGYSKQFIDEHFDEIVDFAEVKQFLDMPLKNYSSGMVARIAFAIATVIIPDILIVDEVLSVGDFMFQEKCEQRINSLIKNHGVTVLIVSHDNYLIERLCNKAIWIEKGHVKTVGSAELVCKAYRVLSGLNGEQSKIQQLFDLIKQPINIPKESVLTIAGEEFHETAFKLFEHTQYPNQANAVIANNNNIAECVLATSLAAQLECPIIYVSETEIPTFSLYALKSINPKLCYIVGSNESIQDSVLGEIGHLLPESDIIRFKSSSLSALSNDICKLSATLDTVTIIHIDDLTDSISQLPSLFRNKIPLILFKTNELTEECWNIITSAKKTILLSETTKLSEQEKERFSNLDITTANIETIDNTACPKTLVACRKDDTFDAIAAIPFVAYNSAEFLIIDPSSVDNINCNIEIIKKGKGAIKQLVFLGGRFLFHEYDKELFATVMVKAWK